MARQCGFYCAVHPWLAREGLVKVGFTSSLARRLTDDCYTTCFTVGEWRYLFTLETATSDAAHSIETGVLHACRHFRLAPRELVRLAPEAVREVAEGVARLLGVAVTLRIAPEYPPPPARPRAAGPGSPAPEMPPEAAASIHAEVEGLTIAPGDGLTAAHDEGVDALAAALLAWSPCFASPAAGPVAASGTDSGSAASGACSSSAVAVRPRDQAGDRGAPSTAEHAGFWGFIGDKVSSIFGGNGHERGAPTAESAAPSPAEEAVLDELDDWTLVGALGQVTEELSSPFDVTAPPAPVALRDYQRVAVGGCLAELRISGRAILQMACRCGKTPIAYEVLRTMLTANAGGPASALFLVPGLPLLRQTAQKLAAYGLTWPLLLVGSDPRPVRLPGGRALTMTTDPAEVAAFFAPTPRVVVCTYQSSALVAGAPFALTIFDEAHRVCGGADPRPFSCVVQAPPTGARLFMTATPVYDPPARTPITMKDRQVFGGVAYRYHLRQGIAAGFVNDFRLEIVAAPAPAAPDAAAEEAAAPAQIAAAMAKVDKLLVFCRNIAHAERLAAGLGPVATAAAPPFEVHIVHSRLNGGVAAETLRRFAAPGVRAALLNVRMFQEGVEIPPLNGVFFAAPRHGFRDIIQSVCRMLNAQPGKPQSVVFLPVLHSAAVPPEDPANLKRYATIIPFVDALLEEDPRLFEHILDPEEHPYPIELLSASALGPLLPIQRAAMLRAIRHAVRFGASTAARPVERLLRAEKIPWGVGFAELSRVVHSCRRYPKTTDLIVVGKAKANLHALYRRYADQYRLSMEGQPTELEPYQLRALEELPSWHPYGIEGPYYWRGCMEFLEQWLADHDGVMPMLCLENGGYIGLDASPMERLSGACTCLNQSDGKARKNSDAPTRGFVVSEAKQADMDRICERYGLRWRKLRDANGDLVQGAPKTCLQESHQRFREYFKTHGPEGEYIVTYFKGYPKKHKAMECPDIDRNVVPTRRPLKGRKFPFRGRK